MKRIGFFAPLLILLFAATPSLQAASSPQTYAMVTELPWSTVQAVLKKVAAQGHYTYTQLEYWYDAGSLTVAQSGSGYVVTICIDGATDILIIDMG